MHSHEVRIDVTGRVGLPGPLMTAASVHLPEALDGPLTVLVGYPGGSYSRGYYDIRHLPGYSQAQYHVDRGCVSMACDHLGIGDSTPVDRFDLSFENMAMANHLTASAVLERLRSGQLVGGVGPVEIGKVVGMGQSMGGCLLTVQQALHRTFDAIAILGFSCLGSNFPAPDGRRIRFSAPTRGADLRAAGAEALGEVAQHADMLRYAFHAADEEPELVEADMPASSTSLAADRALPPWRASVVPACAVTMMGDVVVAEAAAIDTPVLLACGAIDVVPDAWAEPSAFRASHDISVFVVPRMAHMHNFARTREQLWARINRFAEGVLGP